MKRLDFAEMESHLNNIENMIEVLSVQVSHLRTRMESIAASDGATQQHEPPAPASEGNPDA